MKELETITLCDKNETPTVTICNGHVGTKEFGKAWEAEGWDACKFRKDDLRYEYWENKKTKWVKSKQSNYKAQAITVYNW